MDPAISTKNVLLLKMIVWGLLCVLTLLNGCKTWDDQGRARSSLRLNSPMVVDLTKDRMVQKSRTDAQTCSAVWDSVDGPRTVELTRSQLEFFGSTWFVVVKGPSGEVIRQGQLRCNEEEIPYCLVEVKTANEEFPPSYRNKWILAIGLFDEKRSKSVCEKYYQSCIMFEWQGRLIHRI